MQSAPMNLKSPQINDRAEHVRETPSDAGCSTPANKQAATFPASISTRRGSPSSPPASMPASVDETRPLHSTEIHGVQHVANLWRLKTAKSRINGAPNSDIRDTEDLVVRLTASITVHRLFQSSGKKPIRRIATDQAISEPPLERTANIWFDPEQNRLASNDYRHSALFDRMRADDPNFDQEMKPEFERLHAQGHETIPLNLPLDADELAYSKSQIYKLSKVALATETDQSESINVMQPLLMEVTAGYAVKDKFKSNETTRKLYKALQSVHIIPDCGQVAILKTKIVNFLQRPEMDETRFQLIAAECLQDLNKKEVSLLGNVLSIGYTLVVGGLGDVVGTPPIEDGIDKAISGDDIGAAFGRVLTKMGWDGVPVLTTEWGDAALVFTTVEIANLKRELHSLSPEQRKTFVQILGTQLKPGFISASVTAFLNNGSAALDAGQQELERALASGSIKLSDSALKGLFGLAGALTGLVQWMGGAFPLIKEPYEHLRNLKTALTKDAADPNGLWKQRSDADIENLANQSVTWDGPNSMSLTNVVADAMVTALCGGLSGGGVLSGPVGSGLRLLPSNAGEALAMRGAVIGGQWSIPLLENIPRAAVGMLPRTMAKHVAGTVTGMNDLQKHQVIEAMIMAGRSVGPEGMKLVDKKVAATAGRKVASGIVPIINPLYDATEKALDPILTYGGKMVGMAATGLKKTLFNNAPSRQMGRWVSDGAASAKQGFDQAWNNSTPYLQAAGKKGAIGAGWVNNNAIQPAAKAIISTGPGLAVADAFDIATRPTWDTLPTRYMNHVIDPLTASRLAEDLEMQPARHPEFSGAGSDII